MRSVTALLFVCLVMGVLPLACVDPEDSVLRGTTDILVVDGMITNLAEPQLIRLNRSKADPLTGRFGNLVLTKASVGVLVDSIQSVPFQEIQLGTYQAPDGFTGQIGHTYQLYFTLSDGVSYQSSVETMTRVPPLSRVYTQFNPTSFPAQLTDGTTNLYRGAHEVFIDWQDPPSEHNFYRWDWKLYEKQTWCQSCVQGFYLRYNPYNDADTGPYEQCLASNSFTTSTPGSYYVNDYQCRSQCWEIIPNRDFNVFDDQFSNGGFNSGRRIAQIPFYDANGALVEIRQESLSPKAYSFFRLLAEQTQNTGGLADTPPSALGGNVYPVATSQEAVFGYFTVSAVSTVHYWLDRKDATGSPPGLFVALNGRLPSPEGELDPNTSLPKPVYSGSGLLNSSRVPTAICAPSDARTPYKPEGWRD